MIGTGSTIQKRKNTRGNVAEENTNKKEKEKKKGVLRRMTFGLGGATEKSERSTQKKKKKPKTSCRPAKRKSQGNLLISIPEPKSFFIFSKAHSVVPLKSENKITEGQKQVMHRFATEMVKKGPLEISTEFMTKVKPYVGQPLKREVFDANASKNRYKDVICNDLTRVAIWDGKEDTLGDYIHANYVHGFTVPYILTQGPLDRTVNDFWRMIMHTKAAFIVMLCETNEDGKPKCHQYWPDKPGQTVVFGDITITCKTEEDKDEHVIKSLLSLKNVNGSEHMCRHLHTKTWPDKFVPSSTLSLLRMLHVIRASTGPNVVHCSAGIGRTGTFVAVEACLQTIADEKELDLINTVKALRNSRLGSVQVDVQYMTLIQMMLNYGKDNGFWDDSDLDDRIELLTWNLAQFVQTRGRPPPPHETPSKPDVASPMTPPAPKKNAGVGSKDESEDDDKDMTGLQSAILPNVELVVKSGDETTIARNVRDEHKEEKISLPKEEKKSTPTHTPVSIATPPPPHPPPPPINAHPHPAPVFGPQLPFNVPRKIVFVQHKCGEALAHVKPTDSSNEKIEKPPVPTTMVQQQPQQIPQKYKPNAQKSVDHSQYIQ